MALESLAKLCQIMMCDEARRSPSWGSDELRHTSLFGSSFHHKYVLLINNCSNSLLHLHHALLGSVDAMHPACADFIMTRHESLKKAESVNTMASGGKDIVTLLRRFLLSNSCLPFMSSLPIPYLQFKPTKQQINTIKSLMRLTLLT